MRKLAGGLVPSWNGRTRRVTVRRLAAALAGIVLAVLAGQLAGRAHAGVFTPAAPLAVGRYDHSATTLPNGKVLVAGGGRAVNGVFVFLASTELYDPVSNTWSSAGTLSPALAYHEAVLLPNGKVVLFGGCEPSFAQAPQAYDPATNQWSYAGSTVPPAQLFPTATLMANGNVLVAGGQPSFLGSAIRTAGVFQPATNTWLTTPNMLERRTRHRATALPNGKVLVTGGKDLVGTLASTEIYDPVGNNWTAAAPMTQARRSHTATLLPSGKVLVAGGVGPLINPFGLPLAGELVSAELYDPATDTWTPANTSPCQFYADDPAVAGCMAHPRQGHTASLLPNGNVVMVGGLYHSAGLDTAEAFFPAVSGFASSGTMATIRELQRTATLADGRLLVVGGWNAIGGVGTLASAEIYAWTAPVPASAPRFLETRAMNGQVQFAFDPPANDGGSPIIGYTVTTQPPGGVDAAAGTHSRFRVITGLTNETAYTLRVVAITLAGAGAMAVSNPVTPSVNAPSICAGFNDLDYATMSAFCSSVEWIRNRVVTRGCTTTLFCPDGFVIRLQMAAFMKSLGSAFALAELKMEATPGLLVPGATTIVCATTDYTMVDRPGFASISAVMMGKTAGSMAFRTDIVQSTNGGTSWTPIGNPGIAGSNTSQWRSAPVLASADLNANTPYRFALRVTRQAGSANLADSRCQVRVRIDNRNGAGRPYDVDDESSRGE